MKTMKNMKNMKNNTSKYMYKTILLFSLIFVFISSINLELMAQDPLVIDPNGNAIFSGKLGVGITKPLALFQLDIDSSPFATSILGKGNDSNFKIISYQDRSSNSTGATIGGFGLDYNAGTKNAMINFHRGGSPTGGFMSFTTKNNSERLRITSDGKVGIGNTNPIAKLDIKDVARTGTHPSTIKGLYVTGNFSPSSDGIEFRHSNGSQGIGFGYNTIYATGSNGDQNLNILPKGNGNVGIGTTTPTKAKLEVNGSIYYPACTVGSGAQISKAVQEYTIAVAMGGNPTAALAKINKLQCIDSHNLSIYASNNVRAAKFVTSSDERTKNILGHSDGLSDLNTIKKIEITDYLMKDHIACGQSQHKKVIAQQVHEVFPQAVSIMEDVIPDIYQLAQLENGWIPLPTDLEVGDKVRLIFGSEQLLTEVLELNAQGFRVDSNRAGEVFVYGRQVDDFHTVDYDAIAMLNVSATQELLKRIEQLEEEKTELKSKYNKLNDRLSRIEASLEQ